MCINCGGIFAFTRKEEMEKGPTPEQAPQETTNKEAEVSSVRLHDRETTVPDKPPEIGPVARVLPDKQPVITQPDTKDPGSDKIADSSDVRGATGSSESETSSSRDISSERAASPGISEGKTGVDHHSLVSKPRTKQCPKCGRKIFLKGKEEMVKCMFCGTRIQFERKKKNK